MMGISRTEHSVVRQCCVVSSCSSSDSEWSCEYIVGCYCSQPIIRSHCILRSLFEIFDVTISSCTSPHYIVCILLATAGSDAAIILLIMMVPFDSSRQELSNGCHIVFCSNFDLIPEIPGCSRLDLQAVGDFLTPSEVCC